MQELLLCGVEYASLSPCEIYVPERQDCARRAEEVELSKVTVPELRFLTQFCGMTPFREQKRIVYGWHAVCDFVERKHNGVMLVRPSKL